MSCAFRTGARGARARSGLRAVRRRGRANDGCRRAGLCLVARGGPDRRRLRRGSPGLHRRARCRGFLSARAAGAGGDAFGGVARDLGGAASRGRHTRLLLRCDGEEGGRAHPPGGEGVLRRAGGSAGKPRRFRRGAGAAPGFESGLPRPGFGRCGRGRGRAVLRRAHDLAPAPDRIGRRSALRRSRAVSRPRRGVYHAGVRSAHRGAAAAGVIGPFPAGEPHSDGCARERSFRR